jgi:hypothetical protein
MNRILLLPTLSLAALLMSCAHRNNLPTAFVADYHPQLDKSDVIRPPACAALSGIEVRNSLKNAVVGERTLETRPMPVQTISMRGNPASWVSASANEMFRQAGLAANRAGAPRLKLGLSDVMIHENIYVNSGYDGRVTLDASLEDASGKLCWHDRKSGTAKNYGNSGAAINYQETINHALDRAVMAIASDKGFQDAACGHCPP